MQKNIHQTLSVPAQQQRMMEYWLLWWLIWWS